MINDERYDSDFSLEEQELESKKHFEDLSNINLENKISIDLKQFDYDEFILDPTGIKFYKGYNIKLFIPYKAIKEIKRKSK